MMTDRKERLSAILFPHSHASEGEIRRILSFFDTLTIFQPWHMEDRFSIPREGSLEVVHPPEHLRPIQGFPSLLSEYKNWMRQHPDRGYASAMAAVREYEKGGDATWEIRRAIRQGEAGKDRSQAHATQWHLLLHLAREGEENLREAGEVLKTLKERGSPLRDAVVEGEPEGVLDDLSDFDPDRIMEGEFVRMVSGAWQGLFGGLLQPDAVLVTLSPYVFENLGALSPEHVAGEEQGVHRFCWPDLSRDAAEELKRAGETLLDEDLSKCRDGVMRGLENPTVKPFDDLIRDLQSNPLRAKKGLLSFAARRASLRGLSGKLIFLLEGFFHG